MASYNPPVKNAEYIFYISLFAQSDNEIKTTPTLASGDFKVSTDGGATSNLDTLPSESPAASGNVKVTVSAAEMNGDNISVIWKDAAGGEWWSGEANIHPVASGQQFDDLSTFDDTSDTVDVGKISGDSTAADNAELFFDDTGFDASNSTIGTVTTNTDLVTAAAIWTYATRTLTASVGGVTVVSAVSGSTVTVYEDDTWSFTVTDSSLDTDDYENLAFVVKDSPEDSDDDALVYLRSDTDLQRMNGAAAIASGNGSLTATTTSFTVLIAVAETGFGGGNSYTWYLKGFDTTPTPDTAFTLATGSFQINRPGLQAVT